ncbi:hypothetical protein BOX15_Mlig020846g1, partial [Macrostomum lignano]
PSGPHRVGAMDLLTKHGKSGVLMRLFYPSGIRTPDHAVEGVRSYTTPECIQGALAAMGHSYWISTLLNWGFSMLRLRCDWRAEAVGEQLPAIVLSHGLGGSRHLYSSLSLELASHGFVVAAVEHRDGSACATFYAEPPADEGNHGDGPEASRVSWLPLQRAALDDVPLRNGQAEQRAAECLEAAETLCLLTRSGSAEVSNRMPDSDCGPDADARMLDQFKGRIDEKRIHLMGHSFGGASALTALSTAPTGLFRTCTLMDCWMLPVGEQRYSGFAPLPVLFLNNDSYHWETNAKRLETVMAGIADLELKTCVSIRGTNHLAQMDAGFFLWPRLARRIGLCGEKPPVEATILTADICKAFIAKHEGTALTELQQRLLSGEDASCFPGLSWHPDTGRPG